MASMSSERRRTLEIIASILDACQYWTLRIRVMYQCNLTFKLLRDYLDLLLKAHLLLIKNDRQYYLFRVSRKNQRAHAKKMLIGLMAIAVITIASFGLMQKATAVDTVVPYFSNVTADPYPLTAYAGNPVLTASMVTDRNANFVADPSLFYENNVWYMFFEVETDKYGEEIGFAKSTDAFHWNYQQIVLSDSQYRFSFPEVWKVNGIYYMTTDCYGLGTERIYTTTNFPYGWTYASTMVSGKNFADPTVFYYNDIWWLFVSDTSDSNLYLYYSQSITGPYTQHPMSPIVSNDASKARPAGRTIIYNGEILRLTQKCDVSYGEKVRVFQIDTLTTASYAEHEISASPLLSAFGSGWASQGMHTLNAWWNGTNWIEVVDGAGTASWSIGIYYTTKSTLSITIAPTLAVKNVGQSQLFTSTVSGGAFPYSYQWYLNGTAVPSATSSTWTFTPTSPGFYNVYANVTDNTVFTAKSNIATVIVTQALSVTVSPTSAVLDVGQSKQFTSTVSGGTLPYTYQWYLNGTVVSGANSNSWTLAPTSDGSYTVYVRVNDTFEAQTTSNAATVTVNVQLSVTVAPSSVALDIGQSQLFTSSVTGGTSPCSYQWYLNNAPVSGATSATWTFTLSSPASYTVSLEVTDSVGAVATSNAVPISVNVSLSITMAPVSAIMDMGQSQLFASTISGGASPFACQWYLNGAAVSGATRSMWTFTPISSGFYNVYVNVTDNVGVKAESNIAPVTINPQLSVSVSPTSVAMDVGQSRLFTSTVSSGTSPYTYQWYLGGLPVSGATSAMWTFSLTSVGSYTVYVVITDSATTPTNAQSNTAHVTVSAPAPVNPQLSVTISPLTSTIYLSQSQTYTSDVAGTGTSPYSYQWYLNGSLVSGATSSTWTFTPTSTGICQIYVRVTDGVSEIAQSSNAQLIVKPKPPMGVTISSSSRVIDTSQSVPFTSSITGGISPFYYQWYVNGSPVSGATSSTWTFTSTSTGNYEVYLDVTDSLGTKAQSDTVFVTDHPIPSVSISPSSVVMDVGQSQLFTSTVSGGIGPFSYQWCLNGANVSGATSSNWIFTPSSPVSYSVYLIVTDNVGFGAESNTASATVNVAPSVNVSPTSATMDVGQSQLFTSAVSGGTFPVTYTWYMNGTAVSGATSSSWTFTPSSSGSYAVYVNATDNAGVGAKSNKASVTVNPALSGSVSPATVTLDVGQSQLVNSTVSGGTSPYTYQWYLNGTVVSGVTNVAWTFNESSAGYYTVYLNVTDSVGAIVTSNTVNVTVNAVPFVTISPTSATLSVGQPIDFTSTVSDGTPSYSYQWVLNSMAVSGATSATWTFNESSAGYYTVYLNVTDSVGAIVTSNTVNVTVNAVPFVTVSATSVAMDVGQSQLFTSTVSGGSGPFSYQWYLNGATVLGATTAVWAFTPSSSGSYSVYANVTDNVGVMAKSNIALVTVNPTLSVSISPVSVTLDVGQSQLFTSTVSNGTSPYSYQWYLNGTSVSGATSSSWTFTPTLAGSYTVYVTVTDRIGAQASANWAARPQETGNMPFIRGLISGTGENELIIAVYADIWLSARTRIRRGSCDTRRNGHRERWTVKGEDKYFWVRRDSRGRFLASEEVESLGACV